MKTKLLTNFVFILISNTVLSQGTVADYKRAEAIDSLYKNKVYNAPTEFKWLNESVFWYKNTNAEGEQYLLVNAKNQSQKALVDQEKLAKKLNNRLKEEYKPTELELSDFEYDNDNAQKHLKFRKDSLQFKLNLETYELVLTDTISEENDRNRYWGDRADNEDIDPVSSPDENYIAYVKNHNLFIKNQKTEEEFQLSNDGSMGFAYNPHVLWSPDSKKLMAYKVKPGVEHEIYFVESSPEDQLQPRLQSRNYLKPGDELDFKSPQLFNIENKKHVEVVTEQFDQQYSLGNFKWNDNSSAFTFEYNQRGHQVYRVLKVNAKTGEVEVIINETSSTFIDYSGKKYRHDVAEKEEIIWASERDGYNHLYLYDSNSGKVKNQITSGDWPVREVLEVDDEKRQIYFTASGLDKGMDPYYIQYCRIDFDGSNFIRFTTENGNHQVTFSPDHEYYVDQYSRIDLPPVSILKKTGSKKPVMDLQKADISALEATGWQKPEPFVTEGRDGKTPIYGMIVRPSNFDASRTYPIIEYIYAGPHSSFVPKSFNAFYTGMSSLAELGFIVVKIDGMGTSNRSKAFHDVAWKNLKDAGFPDRKLWIQAAAEKYPYMNIDKVGIHGRSAGGQSSAGALIFHSDFYKVAVSSAGCHDNRMDKIWWNEQWMGYPIGQQYIESSNIENASQMEGDLLLIVGELDDNVDPASTYQFVDALIEANKNFDLLVRPGVGHSAGNDDYDNHKRKDFFVEHLLGVDPPEWEKIYN